MSHISTVTRQVHFTIVQTFALVCQISGEIVIIFRCCRCYSCCWCCWSPPWLWEEGWATARWPPAAPAWRRASGTRGMSPPTSSPGSEARSPSGDYQEPQCSGQDFIPLLERIKCFIFCFLFWLSCKRRWDREWDTKSGCQEILPQDRGIHHTFRGGRQEL